VSGISKLLLRATTRYFGLPWAKRHRCAIAYSTARLREAFIHPSKPIESRYDASPRRTSTGTCTVRGSQRRNIRVSGRRMDALGQFGVLHCDYVVFSNNKIRSLFLFLLLDRKQEHRKEGVGLIPSFT
jgi:hypothetical protein